MAGVFNDEMEELCEKKKGRLLGLASLPLASTQSAIRELERIEGSHKHIRGVILGTNGRGKGLDDEEMVPIWTKLHEMKFTTFIHPHYGVGNEHFGNYGHALFLALGFPFETTTAISRLILSGIFDKLPDLKV